MDELPGGDVARRFADRHIVLDDRRSRRNRFQRELVAASDRSGKGDFEPVDAAEFSGREVGQRDGDVVGPSDSEVARSFGHGHFSSSFSTAEVMPSSLIERRSAAARAVKPGIELRSMPQKSVRAITVRMNAS